MHSSKLRSFAFFAFMTALPLSAQQAPRILVTNDDGWSTAGLASLVEALRSVGEVVVSAPLENQSGSSQSVPSMSGGLVTRRVAVPGASEAWAVESSPAGAVIFGLLELGRENRFDLVVSGINQGANVGDVAHVSGTVGAAMQASMLGVPSIAVSQDHLARDTTVAAHYTAKVARAALDQSLPAGVVISINVSGAATQGSVEAQVRPMGGSWFVTDGFTKTSEADGIVQWRSRVRFVTSAEGARGQDRFAGSDTEAYLAGGITVTPLLFDWTAVGKLDWVRSWLPVK